MRATQYSGTAAQAALGGFAAGTAEYIFEKMGVDSLLDLKHVKNPESWIRRGLKQGGLETGGETLTAVSQLLTDTAIMGENSRFERLVDHYMGEELLTGEEARGRAFLDTLKGIILAGFGGFLSGSVLGGTKAGLDSWAGTRSQKAQVDATRAEIDLVDFLQGKYNDGTRIPPKVKDKNGANGPQANTSSEALMPDADIPDTETADTLLDSTLTDTQKSRLKILDNTIEHSLKETDFSGTLRDLQGNPVPNPQGGYYDHLTEMRQSYKALRKVQKSLEGSLQNPNLSTTDKEILTGSLSKTMNYIQRIEKLFEPFGGIE